MPTTLPTFTKTIDDLFMQTWYDIKAEASDNILNATPVWAALKAKGCFKPQAGGNIIERTLDYAIPTVTAVDKTDVLPMGVIETRTAAMWTFRTLASHVQRDAFTDRENRGSYRIYDYVANRIEKARTALLQQYETNVLRAIVTDESGKEIQGLNDMVPVYASRATGNYGGVARSNTWWQPKYKQLVAPYEVNLVDNMKNLYNTISMGMEAPDLLITDQTLFELYESFGLEMSQIVKVANGPLVDLGFEVIKFKGKDMIWTSNMTANNMLFLNTSRIEVVYDPGMWFDMTEFKPIPLQTDRIAHILCTMNMISTELRRHGRLYA
jgi:hypothetical protein